MFRSALILVLMLAPALAAGGPWPREVGQTFLSLSSERDRAGNSYSSIYAEYGLRDRLTFGAEIGRNGVGDVTALVWAQRPLDDGEGPNRFSLQTGAGVLRRGDQTLPMAQGALYWGRGIEGWMGGGWMSAQMLVRMTAAQPDAAPAPVSLAGGLQMTERLVKSELTLGLRPRDRLMVINSLFLEDSADAAFSARLASSLVFDVRGALKIELGAIQPLRGEAERAVKLGSWIEF
ncbi:MAG: hypothetical protein ACK4GT_12895 [Pararhodobacter sp.]